METVCVDIRTEEDPDCYADIGGARLTGSTDIVLDNPYLTEGTIPVGAKLETFVNWLGEECTRHFIRDIQENSLAQRLKFEDGDEIQLIDNDILFNKSHEKTMAVIRNIAVNTEINFVIRRRKPHSGAFENGDSTNFTETFWEIDAEIHVNKEDGKVTPPEATQMHLNPAERHILQGPSGVADIFLKPNTNSGTTLRYTDNRLRFRHGLNENDPTFMMELVKYRVVTLEGGVTPRDPAVMIRHSVGQTRYYLAAQGGEVILKELPGEDPGTDGPVAIDKSCAFFWTRSPDRFERVEQTGCYLAMNKEVTSLALEVGDAAYNTNLRFQVDCKHTDCGHKPLQAL